MSRRRRFRALWMGAVGGGAAEINTICPAITPITGDELWDAVCDALGVTD